MKKIIFAAFLLLYIPFFFSCTVGKKSPSEKNQNTIMDLSEEQIVKGNSYSKSLSNTKSNNNSTSISVKGFSGIETLVSFKKSNDSIELSISCEINNGELRLVLCDSEKIIHEFNLEEKNQTYRFSPGDTNCHLKAVGNKANYSMKITYNRKKLSNQTFNFTEL
ncbi:MAG: hypothetical protein MJ188_02945 [Treponema sp.]|nr:hypothetical protein [Treponema sp.]